MRALYSFFALLVGLLLALPAHASPAADTATNPPKGKGRIIVIENDVEEHVIYLTPGKPAVLSFASAILEWKWPSRWEAKARALADVIEFYVPKSIPSDEITGHVRVATRDYTVIFDVRSASVFKKEPDGAITIKHKDAIAITEAGIEARARLRSDKVIAENEAKYARVIKEKNAKHAEEMARMRKRVEDMERNVAVRAQQAVVRAVHLGHESKPIKMGGCNGRDVVICGLRWGHIGADGILRVAIENRGNSTLEIHEIAAVNKNQRNHAGAIFAGDESNWRNGTLPVTIPPLTQVDVSVLIQDPKSVGNMVKLVLTGPSRALPAAQWIELQPPAEPEREMLLGLKGVLGYIWIGDGLGAGEDQLDSTSLLGVGVRLTYGITERLHFEAEAQGATSGEAQFDNASFDGMQGTLIRTATLGRILGGASFRFTNDKYFPYVRLGVGVQGTSYDSKFTVGGTEAEGPGSSFDVDGLWYFGAGLNVRWRESVIVGFAASFEKEVSTDSRSLQGGIHVGYAWYP